jgi:hypothetical protein
LPAPFGLDALEEGLYAAVQSSHEHKNVLERDVSLTALDTAYVSAVQAGPIGQLLLREAPFLTDPADVRTELRLEIHAANKLV